MFEAPIAPISEGQIAPPTIVITSTDDASFVFLPNPLILKAKMEGNMMDINK